MPDEPSTLESIAVHIATINANMENMSSDIAELKETSIEDYKQTSKLKTRFAVLDGQIGIIRWLVGILGLGTIGVIINAVAERT